MVGIIDSITKLYLGAYSRYWYLRHLVVYKSAFDPVEAAKKRSSFETIENPVIALKKSDNKPIS